MNRNRILALLVCCAMLMGLLAGCGGEEDTPQTQIAYLPTYSKLDYGGYDIESIGNACSNGEILYFIGYVRGGKETYTDENGNIQEYDTTVEQLFRAKMDGTGIEQIAGYTKAEIPDGYEGGSYINNMGIAADGSLWLMENVNTYTFELPENFDPATDERWNYYKEGENSFLLRQLNADGTERSSIDLGKMAAKANGDNPDEENGNYYYIYNVSIDKDGNIYFYDGNSHIVVLDPNGEMLFSIQDDNIGGNMVTLNDGRVAVMTYGETRAMKPIDIGAKAWGEDLPMPTDWNQFYNGSGEYLYYYTTSSSLFACKSDGTTEKMLTWLNCDVNQDNLSGIAIQSFEQVSAVETTWNNATSTQNCQLVSLKRTEVPPENQKKTLSLAVMYLDWDLRDTILQFNRKNTEYRIEVQDYSEFNTEDDYTAGITKLTTEILTGKVPDIIVDSSNQLPLRQYAAKGLLEDLLPYLDADTELGGREALFQPVMNAMMQDGKLYRLGSNFAFTTAFTNKKVAGDITGWTPDEARAALEKLPEGAGVMNFYTTQSDLLTRICQVNLGSYINWDTGECTFETGGFDKLLEFSTLAPKEITEDDWNDPTNRENVRIPEGRQLMQADVIYDWYELMYARTYWGDDMICVGFPSEDRQGSSFTLNNCMAISSKCQYKDVAWQFVREQVVYDENNRGSWGFPLNQKAMDAMITEAMTPETYVDENGVTQEYSKVEYGSEITGETIKITKLSEADRDLLMDAMERTTKLSEYDESIMSIINDEAQAFIDGNASAQQVAANVQNRVNLYVNEQR